jgi:hypothetical protein
LNPPAFSEVFALVPSDALTARRSPIGGPDDVAAL